MNEDKKRRKIEASKVPLRSALNEEQMDKLRRAGLRESEIEIVGNNIAELISEKKVSKEVVVVVVEKLANERGIRGKFFKEPRKMIVKMDPQPSP
ncbi:MAG: hypothetical protein ACTSWR_09400 [Candidatus Helarchaeota archaeon]